MMCLALADLRANAVTLAGVFLIAATCGFIGGWCASLLATSHSYANLESLSMSVLAFSSVAALAVMAASARLTVSAQRRTYALWQLANLSPARISAVVLFELFVTAALGALSGTALEAATFTPLFPWVFSSPFYQPIDQVVYDVGLPLMPAVWLATAGMFLAGGVKGARDAGRVPAIAVCKEPQTEAQGMTWRRGALLLPLAGLIAALALSLGASSPESNPAWSLSLFLPLTLAAAFADIAPVALPVLLRGWTALLPDRWTAWFLARRSALHGLGISASIETPVAVGVGVTAGLLSLSNLLQEYIILHGMNGWNAALDWTSAVLLLGGPVLLCVTSAAIGIIMSCKERSRDAMLLMACGAGPLTLVAAALCEAAIHGITSLMAGLLIALASTAITSCAAGMAPLCGLSLGEGFAVAGMGLALQLVAVLVPTLTGLLNFVPKKARGFATAGNPSR